MDVILTSLFVLLGIAATSFVAYVVNRHNNSGQIETSAAVELWKEGSDLRSYLTTQVVGLREQLIKSLAEATAASTRMSELLVKVETEHAAATAAQEETRRARVEMAELKTAIEAIHADVRTGNTLTAGALLDATESRRIALIPPRERTTIERDHLESVSLDTAGREVDRK